jgi:hypothetical protein
MNINIYTHSASKMLGHISTASSSDHTKEKISYKHTAHLRQQCQNKMCDFSGETFKGFEVLSFSMSATTTQLLSSGEFCKLHYDTIPVKSASANVSFFTNNSNMPNFDL